MTTTQPLQHAVAARLKRMMKIARDVARQCASFWNMLHRVASSNEGKQSDKPPRAVSVATYI